MNKWSLNAECRSEKGQRRNHGTANNFFSPKIVAWKTVTLEVGILYTHITALKTKEQA